MQYVRLTKKIVPFKKNKMQKQEAEKTIFSLLKVVVNIMYSLQCYYYVVQKHELVKK